MIIFDLDTLADDSHRRHFIDDPRSKGNVTLDYLWQPDYKAYWEACVDDKPIEPFFKIMSSLDDRYEIWSGRCESFWAKTERWLLKFLHEYELPNVKMRPINDTKSADWELKEGWLEDHIANGGDKIEFVFDSEYYAIDMWRRRGIFVFDCRQD